MRFRFIIFPILLFFRVEILHFFINISLFELLLFIGISSLCLFYYKRKIKCTAIVLARKLKYFNLRKYRIKISNWAKENSAEEMGKSLVAQLERNVWTNLGCIILSVMIFSHFPSLLTNPKPATIFLLTMTAYVLIGLAFRKETLIFMVGLYLLMSITPYFMAFLSYDSGINLFETLPSSLVSLHNIDISNLTQTANKLFFSYAPWYTLLILSLILLAFIIKGSLKFIFAIFLKMLQVIEPSNLTSACTRNEGIRD